MVYFTCNNCGASLKKKDCANHAGKCRPLALTCCDCHKDFYGDQYVAHTSCITEAEKYSAKGFISPAPSTAGVAKQEEWMRAVHLASEAPDLTNNQRSFLETLTRHGNVSRKKKQFQNFARNVWRDSYRQTEVVEQVFSMIELELQKIKGPPKENVTITAKVESTQENGNAAEKNIVELAVEDLPSKKSKKHKRKKEVEMDKLSVNGDGEAEKTEDVSSSKKKKKNKNRTENGMEEIKENGHGTEVASEVTTSKKNKKKKHEKQEADAMEVAKENGNGTEEAATSKKSKKEKHKKQEEDTSEVAKENGNGTEEAATSKKSKKEKKKLKMAEAAEENGHGVEKITEETVEDEASMKKSKKKGLVKLGEKGMEQTTENENGLEKIAVDVAKHIGKKSKKKKHKQQEDEEEVPRKKLKSASG